MRIALGVGFLAFLCLLVVGQLAMPQALIFVWLAAAGFLAVFLYRRSTGQRLSVMNGARLGWISGIFGFVIVTIILTMFVDRAFRTLRCRDSARADENARHS